MPQATETVLGGIKAAEKTETDTQEVKIDTASGKLYVQSGGGGTNYDNPIDEPPSTPNAMDDEFDGTTLNSKWSWLDQGSATIDLNGKYLKMNMFSSSDNNRMIIQPIPTVPFEVTAKIRMYIPNFNWATFGITIYNSANNKRGILGIGTVSGNSRAHLIQFTSATAWNADTWSINGFGDPSAVHYVKVTFNTTSFSFYLSSDGDEWIFIGTDTYSRWIGAVTHVGIGYFRNNTDGVNRPGRCDWFRVTQ